MASISCRHTHSIVSSITHSSSLGSRVLGWTGACESLSLPSISIKLPQFLTGQTETDSRLEELKKQLESEESPFMIDNGMILRAAPKQHPSYRKRRQKLYAPGDKQIQPLNNIVRCPACGHVKRSHFMCMHCFAEIRTFLKEKKKQLQEYIEPPQSNLDPVDHRILYLSLEPGKSKKKPASLSIPMREEPLPFDSQHVKHPKK